ncbi:MAG: hypothetical protein ACHQF2_07275 [Flavobacteriales bacterium]
MEKNLFDLLAKKAYAENAGVPELNELWGNTFLLDNWFFIARGPIGHPHPYIASRPDTCEGKHMIRAFTDTEKLSAFAKENNLLEEDNGIRILTVPTIKIINWITPFAQHEVFGIWFNSDNNSNGFYAPILQLQSIKEYLDKTWVRNPRKN